MECRYAECRGAIFTLKTAAARSPDRLSSEKEISKKIIIGFNTFGSVAP
jgi:hypothetical protein